MPHQPFGKTGEFHQVHGGTIVLEPYVNLEYRSIACLDEF